MSTPEPVAEFAGPFDSGVLPDDVRASPRPLVLRGFVADWPLVPRTMVITVLVVVLMTWVVAPRLTRWLAGWLHARPPAGGRP